MNEDKDAVEVLFLGTLKHSQQHSGSGIEKQPHQDEIKFKDPVQVDLLRILHFGR